MSYKRTIRDSDSYRERLDRFLTDKCLLFNPYTVSDERLWSGIMKMRWRGPFSLTQMVILHFLDIRSEGIEPLVKERVVYSIGDSSEEITSSITAFTLKRSAADSCCQVRSLINGRPITQAQQIHALIGKSVFVSRNITTVNRFRGYGIAMNMHRLKGRLSLDAAMIRTAIINSKLEMLDRLLAYPYSDIYLNGEPSEPVDITTPINRIKALISTFAAVIPPCE